MDSRFVAAKITDLNNKAVELYGNEDFRNAYRFFEEATVEFLRQHQLDFSLHTIPITHVLSKDQQQQQHQKAPSSNDAAMTGNTDTVIVAPPTSSYMYQRVEFDEGVVLFSETKIIGNGDHPLSVKATLLFNAGQARRELDDVLGAAKYYEDALCLFLPSGTKIDEKMPFALLTTIALLYPSYTILGKSPIGKEIFQMLLACINSHWFTAKHSMDSEVYRQL